MSSSFRADLALIGLSVVGVLSDLACVLTNHTPPSLFDQVALAGLAGAAGLSIAPTRTPDAPAPAPAQPAPVPGDAGYSGPVGA